MNECQMKINIIANESNNNDATFLKKTIIYSGPQTCEGEDRNL
jgi:hypothetical protein